MRFLIVFLATMIIISAAKPDRMDRDVSKDLHLAPLLIAGPLAPPPVNGIPLAPVAAVGNVTVPTNQTRVSNATLSTIASIVNNLSSTGTPIASSLVPSATSVLYTGQSIPDLSDGRIEQRVTYSLTATTTVGVATAITSTPTPFSAIATATPAAANSTILTTTYSAATSFNTSIRSSIASSVFTVSTTSDASTSLSPVVSATAAVSASFSSPYCTSWTLGYYCGSDIDCNTALGYTCVANRCSPPPTAVIVGNGGACDQGSNNTLFCTSALGICVGNVCTACRITAR